MIRWEGGRDEGTLTATGKDYQPGGRVVDGTVTAEVVEKTSLKGKLGEADFTATYDSLYDNVATLDPLVTGPWLLADNAGTLSLVNVAADGKVTGAAQGVAGGECPLTGEVVPEPGKNYYKLEITFADSAECQLPNQTVEGVAIHQQGIMIAGLLSNDQSRGLFALGTQDFR
ncbi:MAG: hypothetical protein QHC78_09980 [Pigmentiphaga sp.]|uniref:hypothetical protein n=1 Tax=Pigmentiphaga sp. TaxID=1977564 RepID=UPI0029A59986|nr:hypothetical protein [Pigmentiphaga sp.]MDX3906002.1 hypothetical protein [Pigmentiphaga sp.]